MCVCVNHIIWVSLDFIPIETDNSLACLSFPPCYSYCCIFLLSFLGSYRKQVGIYVFGPSDFNLVLNVGVLRACLVYAVLSIKISFFIVNKKFH